MRRLFISLGLAFATFAATAQQIKPTDADMQDVLSILRSMGNEIHSFDISQLADTKYDITIFVNEYRAKKLINADTLEFGPNITPYAKANKLGLYVSNFNDSTKQVTINLQINSYNVWLNLLPRTNSDDRVCNYYHSRPFKIKEFKPGTEIPLLMIGSAWYDPQNDVHRFCGENELSADMSNEIFTQSSHYYVISVQFDKVTN